MYYKDEHIELRLGLGFKEIKPATDDLYNFILSKIDATGTTSIVEVFTSVTGLSAYPVDGEYSLEVSTAGVANYLIYLNINDAFITEFIKQIQDIICNCTCTPCSDGGNELFAIKRQKLFNTTFILPNTIKPFSYGQATITNLYLSSFIQLYFNATILDKKTELGKEYFNYYITGTSTNNATLFNTIIIANYYALYFYYKTLILLNIADFSLATIASYTKVVNDFFKFTELTSCLSCYVAGVNLETINTQAFNVENLSDAMNQNNFSRTINIKASDLSGTGTLEEKIIAYVNSLPYIKEASDADIWINYDPEA